MTNPIKLVLMLTILLWSSAFVGIRAALHGYSPEGLALLRYLVASLCLAIVYYRLPARGLTNWRDRISLMMIGAIGIGLYGIALNHGELVIESGMASFIISMSPVITAILAIVILRERVNYLHILGLLVSIVGVLLISVGEEKGLHWDASLGYILLATVVGSGYSVAQKPFVEKYNIIEVTSYVIWGGALFLLFYFPALLNDFHDASMTATAIVIYLGVFPAAIGYIGWNYVLTAIPASRAVTFLYFQPFLVTLLGWLFLGEIPVVLSLCGGMLAIAGVWLVNKAYQIPNQFILDIPSPVGEKGL